MSSIIKIPSAPISNAIHWGSSSKFERFVNANFIETATQNTHKITNVKYEPDSIYQCVDGMAGCCWTVAVRDPITDTFANYYIRNWIDIVHYYEQKGFQFIEN